MVVHSLLSYEKGALLHLHAPMLDHADAVSVGEVAAEVQMTGPPRQSADGPSEEASSDGDSQEDSPALRQMMRSPMFCVSCSVLLHGLLGR